MHSKLKNQKNVNTTTTICIVVKNVYVANTEGIINLISKHIIEKLFDIVHRLLKNYMSIQ